MTAHRSSSPSSCWHASEAFYEQGYHGTTVRDIAARVGVTVPALYYHHENKAAILVAVLNAAMADLLPRGEAAVADGQGDPVQEISNLVESIGLHMTVRARLAALDSEYRYLAPDVARLRRPAQAQRDVDAVRGRAGRRAGRLRRRGLSGGDPSHLGMLQAIARWYDDTGSLTPAQVATRYADLALATLGVSPEVRARVAAAR